MFVVCQQDLQDLPLRGIVAFAVCCARRVQPIFNRWNQYFGNPQHAGSVETALQLAEHFATGVKDSHVLVGHSDEIPPAAMAAANATMSHGTLHEYNAALAAAYAAFTTVSACVALRGARQYLFGKAAAANAYEAQMRMVLAMDEDREAQRQMLRYFSYLQSLDLGMFPELGRVVPMREQRLP